MNTPAQRKATPLQHPELVKAAGLLAELADALKSGTLQGCVEHNEATGLFDRLMPQPCSECGNEKYTAMNELISALLLVRDHVRMMRTLGRGTAPLATVERAKTLRKASRAKA